MTNLETMFSALQTLTYSDTSNHAKYIAGEVLDYAEREILPSGSGFDNGTKINRDASSVKQGAERIVLTFGYHHLNGDGYYTKWTQHTVTIRPTLQYGRYLLNVTNARDWSLRDYFVQTIVQALDGEKLVEERARLWRETPEVVGGN